VIARPPGSGVDGRPTGVSGDGQTLRPRQDRARRNAVATVLAVVLVGAGVIALAVWPPDNAVAQVGVPTTTTTLKGRQTTTTTRPTTTTRQTPTTSTTTTTRPTTTTPTPPTTRAVTPTTFVTASTTPIPTGTTTASTAPSSVPTVPPPSPAPTTSSTVPTQPGLVIRLNQPSSEPGGRLSSTGSGCSALANVVLTINGATVGAANADQAGAFQTEVLIPDVAVGRYDLVADCGLTSTTPIDVVVATRVDGGISTLALLIFFVLLALMLFRRRHLVPSRPGRD